ncbi:hypothetical protein RhiirA5_423765 [Rhizophagus irregularis]|uniref:Ubiquitin-like domain-containing protein n=2 Tax=Rhizophagus irregularis TaxID=588596 RepID=A0A2I1ERG7_9GLOM|nr:hypothetical protein RhiirA5_423765 [Rhizophagus irregularis]PKC69002.1 hypothetical protein RhiirA1_392453 [Rhizophagus irregularis]PKY24704.1 hypothetical protein RhiirB3_439369 [Rhizophagus irregularis]CAB4477885.1 unnamed protein product [Rhizophagus irregularis]CAB5370943.1 unnamed protein product [Rhizophagus irregularis]
MDETLTLQFVAEAMSAIIGCRVIASESERTDLPTLNIDLVHKYCLLQVDDNGEVVKKSYFEEFVKQNEIRQGGDETRQDGDETNQGGSEVKQDGDETNQGGSEVKQDGDETNQGGSEVKQGGSEVKQGGSETRQGGNETGQGGQGLEIVYSRPFVISSLLLSVYLLLYHNYIFMFIGLIALTYYFFIRQVDENVQVNPDTFQIFFNFSGESRSIFVAPNSTILELRQKIQAKLNIDKPLSLSFSSKILDDRNTLESYNIKQSSTINVSYKLLGGSVGDFVISRSFLKPQFDYDYTNAQDNGQNRRGYETYHLPIGWQKYGLDVDRYGDNKWLGTGTDAWPISYHGTDLNAASNIAVGGFDSSKGKRFAFGKGIYSSPYSTEAEAYSTTFPFNNHTYRVMFQNRVNPADLRKANQDRYWITVTDQNIRPYALCWKMIS